MQVLPADVGHHELTVSLQNEKNEIYRDLAIPVLPFEIPTGGRVHNAVINIAGMLVPPIGKYCLKAFVDGAELAQWPLEILAP